MRLIFMGTPDFSVPALRALVEAGHDVVAVYSQPPRPAGRGQSVRPSAVHQAALDLGIEVRTPVRVRRDPQAHADFAALNADAAIVAAYGLILPAEMLNAPRLGCLNIHASLLPRWRGAAPIQAAVLHGDASSGVSIMQMDEGLDTGAVLAEEAIALDEQTTAASLHDALSAMGGRMVVDVLANPRAAVPQPTDGVTYAPRLTRDDGRIDWAQGAVQIDRQIRGLTPWPGTWTTLDGTVIKIGAAQRLTTTHAEQPGRTLDDALTVACGEGAIRITQLQRPGRGMMAARDFLRGHPVARGSQFGV